MKTLILIPTYNESANISLLLQRLLRSPETEVLIIDDNSPDGTASFVQPYMATGRVQLLSRKKKEGRRSAILDGLRLVFASKPSFAQFVEMDADFSHNPEELPNLIAHLENFDVVIGSRYLQGSKLVCWPLHRQLFSRFANLFIRLIFRIPLTDFTSGYRCYRAVVAETLMNLVVNSKGFFGSCEVAIRLYRQGYSFTEAPITFMNRRGGKSKFGLKEVAAALLGTVRMLLSDRER